MAREVLEAGYEVRPGDNVGSIAAGFVGDAMAYSDLVGANLHKPLIDHGSLSHKVFASLQAGEKLNVPASWLVSGQVGAGHSPLGPTSRAPTLISGDVIGQLITQMQGLNLPGMTVPTTITPTPDVSQVLAQWWPYLQVPPNGYSLPTYDPNAIFKWLGLQFDQTPSLQNFGTLQQVIAAADRYAQAIGSVPYLPWDHVPWEDLAQKWPTLLVALGSSPTALTELANFAATIAAIPMAVPTTPWVSYGSGSPLKTFALQTHQYPPPNFVATDWTSPGYKELIAWLSGGSFDPTKVPWDLLLATDTAACIQAHPDRLAQIYADAACYKNPACYGDPLSTFKEKLCAPTYQPGWCNSLPCGSTVQPPPGQPAPPVVKKSNAGLWIVGAVLVVGIVGVGLAMGMSPKAGSARSNPVTRRVRHRYKMAVAKGTKGFATRADRWTGPDSDWHSATSLEADSGLYVGERTIYGLKCKVIDRDDGNVVHKFFAVPTLAPHTLAAKQSKRAAYLRGRGPGPRRNPSETRDGMPGDYVKRYIGDAVVHIRYEGYAGGQDTYSGYVEAAGLKWKFDDLHPAPAGFGPGVGYDSAKAYDEMAQSAAAFGSYYTSNNRGDDTPEWAPEPEVADAIEEAASWVMDDHGNYEVKRSKRRG